MEVYTIFGMRPYSPFSISIGQFLGAPFHLPGLADQVLIGHTMAAVQHHVIRVLLNLRHIQNTNEVIGDHDPLRLFRNLLQSWPRRSSE